MAEQLIFWRLFPRKWNCRYSYTVRRGSTVMYCNWRWYKVSDSHRTFILGLDYLKIWRFEIHFFFPGMYSGSRLTEVQALMWWSWNVLARRWARDLGSSPIREESTLIESCDLWFLQVSLQDWNFGRPAFFCKEFGLIDANRDSNHM